MLRAEVVASLLRSAVVLVVLSIAQPAKVYVVLFAVKLAGTLLFGTSNVYCVALLYTVFVFLEEVL